MRNLSLEIEYDGTNYCGWQIQTRHKRKKSIQEVIEKTLHKILQERVKLIAQGRTDSGVHAKAQIANFKTASGININKLKKSLNQLLPEDIAVNKIKEEASGFHSRFDVKSKVYRYTIFNRRYPSVFLREITYFYPYPLDLEVMRNESRVILGRHNFKSFQASDKKERNPVKIIKRLDIRKKGSLVYIDIEADGFLYNMVRNIVGTLIEIGRGRFSAGSLIRILSSKDRSLAGPTVPAKGLCLLKVNYK